MYEKTGKKRCIRDFKTRIKEANKNVTIKNITDFDINNSNSIKSLTVKKKNTNVKVTSRFMNGEMLMFSKVLLLSFINGIIDVFCFPSRSARDILSNGDIIKSFIYLILTETYSCSMFFYFTYKLQCTITEENGRDFIFELLIESKFFERIDLSDFL